MPSDQLPQIAGPFVLKSQIATGASATVYEAVNTDDARVVALKVFHPALVNDLAFNERLQREAEALALLKHPNIVQLIRPWSTGSQFFLELELVEGRTLKAWTTQNEPVWIEPHLYILAQVARALGAVHEQQILHRDLKPDNILVSPEGVAKLTDFGLARSEFFRRQLTQTGSIVGSLAYMAPETIDGQPATYASDIFSFGVVAYELLCGKHPFMDDSGQILMNDLLAARFAPIVQINPRVPLKIARLIEDCLRLDRNDRPNSIWLVEAGLMDFLQMSGQLMRVKEWMRTGDPELFSAALSLKHSILKNDIRVELARGTERAILLAKVNQFHALFPDDPALETMMSEITGAKKTGASKVKVRFLLTLVGLVLGIWASVALMNHYKAGVPVESSTPVNSASEDDSRTEAVMMANPPALDVEKPVAISAKLSPRPSVGTLRLLIDEGVSAFVDGRRISSSQLANYKIRPGRYTLVLEKPGYQAIEQIITVKPAKITIVNAKTEAP